MHQDKCDLCGTNSFQKLFVKNGFNIVKCRQCRLVFTHPQDNAINLQKRYNSADYFNTRYVQKYGYGNYAAGRHLLDAWFNSQLDVIEKLYPQRGKILDIGCALGFFLDLARYRGWETYGIDYSGYAVEYACNKLQLNVQHCPVEEIKFPANTFDIVTLFDVIEHVRKPSVVLEAIHRILVPNGLLVMTTPNCDGLLRKIMRRYWFHFKPLEHTFFFSPATMQAYLSKFGFQTIKMEYCKKIVDLDFLVNRAFHYNPYLPKFTQFLLKTRYWKTYTFPFLTGEFNIYTRKFLP